MSVRLAKRLIEPDHWTCPHGRKQRPESVLTYGPEVADVNAAAGFAPDPQQELGLDLIFAIRPDGLPASFEFCVICCRQNLKTGLFKQAAIGFIYVTDTPLVVWSAHEMSTTTEAQRELANMILGSPTLRRRLLPGTNDGIYYANGEERIEFAKSDNAPDGQRIMFKARTRDGGRGLAAPRLILDEAFALKKPMMGALLPLMTAQTDAQVLYGSSAGKDDSEVLFDIRDRGRKGSTPRLSYLEWLSEREACGDPECVHPKDAPDRGIDCALDREHLLIKANPTISTGRITLERLRDLRQAMPPEEFMRECLGWWPEPVSAIGGVFKPGAWAGCAVPKRPELLTEGIALGVACSIDGVWTSIGAATPLGDDRWAVGAVDRSRGSRRLKAQLRERHRKYGCRIAVDVKGPAGDLIGWLEEDDEDGSGLNITRAGLEDVLTATATLRRAVDEQRIEHENHPELNAAVAAASLRWASGDRQALGRRASAGDIAMLESVNLAVWAASSAPAPVEPFAIWG